MKSISTRCLSTTLECFYHDEDVANTPSPSLRCVCHAAAACAPAGNPSYSVGLMPSNTFVLEMAANSTGSWNYYCNILDHINAGMKARMVVS
jgi:uncharacterized cupredoxin-like copper-binding protein